MANEPNSDSSSGFGDGAEDFVFRKITEYVLGAIAGLVATVSGLIDTVFNIYIDAINFSTEQFGRAILPRGVSNLGGIVELFRGAYIGLLETLVPYLGPFAAPLVTLVAVGFTALLIRAGWSVLDSIPVAASIKGFLEGS